MVALYYGVVSHSFEGEHNVEHVHHRLPLSILVLIIVFKKYQEIIQQHRDTKQKRRDKKSATIALITIQQSIARCLKGVFSIFDRGLTMGNFMIVF